MSSISSIKILKYWQKNLAESLHRDLQQSSLRSASQISRDEFEEGKINAAKFLSEIRTERKKYLLCPYFFQKTDQQGHASYLPLLIIPVEITHDGRIEHAGEKPFIPRKYLRPNEKGEVTISSVERVQRYWRENPFVAELSWQEMLECAERFRQRVIDRSVRFRHIRFSEHVWVCEDAGKEKSDAAISAIQYFYEGLLWGKGNNIKLLQPLAKHMLSLNQGMKQTTLPDFHPYRLAHLGQMNPAYGLTSSQRAALHHYLALKNGECLAVEGPPGTGKTTLLQSVIASLWVNKALAENTQAPVILASSATNLAIQNMLDMFHGQASLDTVSFPDHPLFERAHKLDQHWLPDIKRLGAYCVSQSGKNKFQNYQLVTRQSGKEQRFQTKNWLNFEQLDPEQLASMESYFLQKCEHYFRQKLTGIQHAKVLLHRRLRQIIRQAQEPLEHLLEQKELKQKKRQIKTKYQVDSIEDALEHVKAILVIKQQQLTQLQETREQWHQYQGKMSTGIIHVMMSLPWIGTYLQKRRAVGNRYFIERRLPNYTFSETTDTAIDQRLNELEEKLQQEITQRQKEQKSLQRWLRRWDTVCKREKNRRSSWEALGFSQEEEELELQLDRTHRVVAFWIATHYWEAQFLLTAGNRLKREDSRHQSTEEFFRELALLSPCIVVTMYSAPRFFQEGHYHLHGFADLLIIDEASQALPEIAFPTFALAQRAIVVGDTKQLPPIPSIDQKQDEQNLRESGLGEWIEALDELGISPNKGSVMKWANRQTNYVEKNGKPFLLREHFRCHSKVARYFNLDFYQNQLVIKTRDREDFGLPSLAYVHVNGVEEPAGGSRINHIEAATIAWWIRQFLQANNLKSKPQQAKDSIAVLTPFKAQADVIKNYLRKLQIADLLTVGTVHSLQGMEKEVILFSPTYTSLTNQEYFYDRDDYILNVATSRAKQSFLIFGDMNCFGVQKKEASARLKSFCQDATDQLHMPSEKQVEKLLDRSYTLIKEDKEVIINEYNIFAEKISNSIVGNKVTHATLRSENHE